MTRLVLAALAALSVLPAAHAQATFGLKAGLNVSRFAGESAPTGAESRLGVAGGVTADVPLTPQLSFRPEVLYAMKGVTDGDVTLAVDYVEIPALLAVTVPATDTGLLVGAYAGPVLGLKVRESLDGSFGSISGGDVFNSTDVGAAVGLTVGAGPFAVDGRYTIGLTDAAENLDLQNHAFTISGVYRFGR